MKKALALLLAVLMLLPIVACSNTNKQNNANENNNSVGEPNNSGNNASPNETETSNNDFAYWPDEYLKDRIAVSLNSEVNGFQVTSRKPFGGNLICIYEKLVQPDAYGNTKLQVLKSLEQVDDYTWNLELWDIVYDTAGNNIKADDVRAGFQLLVDKGKSAAISNINIRDDGTVDIDVTGDYTLTLNLKYTFGPGELNNVLSSPDIVSQNAYDVTPDELLTQPVGTGPYMLKEFVIGSKIVLEANPNYWMKNVTDEAWLAENFYVTNAQNVKEIELDIIKDATTRAMALENKDVCALDSANAIDVERYAEDSRYGITAVPTKPDTPVMFYFNASDVAPTSDENLRKAICYAVNNEEIANGLSLPAVACNAILPDAYDAPEAWSAADRDYYGYNLDKAKEYLEKSNYSGEEIVCVCETGSSGEEAMILVESQLRALGIKMTIIAVDTTTMIDYRCSRPNDWEIMVETVTGSGYLAGTMKKFWSVESADTHNGNQVFGILDTKLDDLFVAMKENTNEETAVAWDNYLTYEKCYAYALCSPTQLTACLDWVNCVLGGDKGNKIVPGAFTFND